MIIKTEDSGHLSIYAAIFQNTPHGVLILKKSPAGPGKQSDLLIAEVNPALADILGENPQTLTGGGFEKFFPDHAARWDLQLSAVFCEKSIEKMTYSSVSRNNQYSITAFPADPETAVLLFHPAENSSGAAGETSFTKSLLLANVSHELRTPLNGIIGLANLLEESIQDEDQRDLLSMISYSANNLNRIIQDLLELNRIESGSTSIHKSIFSLKETAERVVQQIEGGARKKGIVLSVKIEDELPPYYGDRNRTAQIITNLLNNALQYTEKGSISLSVSRPDKSLCICVTDTGIGIPRKELTAIFESFRVVENPYTKEYSGMGLGLSIVNHLVHLLGGKIAVESVEGSGSNFMVTFPWEEVYENHQLNTENPEYTRSDRLRILIAEDEAVNRIYLRTLLERQGYLVDEARNGKEACTMTIEDKEGYDLVLMDIYMPGRNGIDSIAEIRRKENGKNIRTAIIALTASSEHSERNQVMEAGADGFISKPVNEMNLFRCIRRIIYDRTCSSAELIK